MNFATIALLGFQLVAAAPAVTHFFPSSVTRGGFPVLVSAEGSTGTDSKIWVDDEKLKVQAGPKSGQFLVEAVTGCRPGWHTVRLYNKEGATNPIPVWVDDLPNFAETEPNNGAAQATSVPLHRMGSAAQLHGRLEKNGDIDGYLVKVPAGSTLVARLEANRHLGSPMDGTLQIVDKKGFVLAHNDDARGVDPEITWKATQSAEVIVRVFAFPSEPNSTISFAGGSSYIYRLMISTSETIDHAASVVADKNSTMLIPSGWNLSDSAAAGLLPTAGQSGYLIAVPEYSEPMVVPRTEFPVVSYNRKSPPAISQFPVMLSGTINELDESHVYQIQAQKGEAIQFRVFARQWESLLDPVLTIRDEKGQIVQEQDDSGNNTRDLELTWTPPENGLYRLAISDLHGRSGLRMFYGVECTREGIEPEAQISVTNLTLKAAEKAELAMNYDKRADLDIPLKVEFIGLPKGFPALKATEGAPSAPPAQTKGQGRRRRGPSGAGMNSLKFEINLTADQVKQIGEFSGPIRFQVKDNSGKSIPVSINGEKGKRLGLDHVWLTVLATPAKTEPPKAEKK